MQPPPRDETRRLTGHLRAFGRVSADVSREPVFVDERLLRRKQKIKRASDAPEKKWCDLKMEISGRCSRTDLAKVQGELRHLHSATREIVGDDVATAVVDSAAVFLYILFAVDQRWSREHAEKIRKTLGPFPASAANRACESVKRIVKLLPENIGDDSKNSTDKETHVQDKEMKREFGSNIVFASPKNIREEVAAFSSEENGGQEIGRDSLSEDEEAESNAFSQALLMGMAQTSKTDSGGERVKSKTISSGKPAGVVAMGTGDPAPYTSEWLAGKLKVVCAGGGMTWNDLYMAVFDVLSSAQDNSAIQGELVELLGFSQLGLIEDLLTHRQQLVSSALDDSSLLFSRAGKSNHHVRGERPPVQSHHRPAVSSQVVIQVCPVI
jgi:hypothetical protein